MTLPETGVDDPAVSVVIAAYNCEQTIAKCLQSLASMDHSSFEVIVIDDGSTDRTRQECQEFDWIRLLSVENGGPSRARNIGIKMAHGRYVAFTDGDCIVDPEWLTQLAKPLDDPHVAGVGGDQISPEDESEKGRMITDFMKTIAFITDYVKDARVTIQTDHNPTCNVMYRRSVLDEVGGFDENLWPGEDVDLDIRIRRRCYRLLFNPGAIVRHYRPSSYRAYARMMKRYGSAQAYLVRRYGRFRKIHYVPLLLSLGLCLIFSFAGLGSPRLAYVTPVAPYTILLFLVPIGHTIRGIVFTYLFIVTVAYWNLGFWTDKRNLHSGG